MEVYRHKTSEIVWRFLRHRLTFPQCIDLLDAELAAIVLRTTTNEELPTLRALVLANNEMVMVEMERRGPDPLVPSMAYKA